jgi:nucleoside-diphosphate-sugar epimerase
MGQPWETVAACVTGGRGSLGRRVVERLAQDGARRIVTLGRSPEPTSRDTASAVEHVRGSLLDDVALDQALAGCDVVFHLAALVHAGRSRLEPLRCFEVNALGTARLLEACRRQGVRRVVYASTVHVYGEPHYLPVDEQHPVAPLSIYAASKLAGEAAVAGYAADHRLICDIARLANVYGGSLDPETVIGRALEQAAAGGSIRLRSLAPVRDFVHADDAAEALVQLAGSDGERAGLRTVNVSSGQGVSVGQIACTLARLAGTGATRPLDVVEEIRSSSAGNLSTLVFDNRRIREATGWAPRINLEQGLALALDEARQSYRSPERA